MRAHTSRPLLFVCITLLIGPICSGAWLWKQPQTVGEEASQSQDSEFIGWQGESYQADELAADGINNAAGGKYWIETLSWSPRAFLLHNFLSKEEAQHLVSLGKDKLQKSSVVDSDTGEIVASSVRTSSGVFLQRQQDAVVSTIEERLAEVTHLPLENGEPLHILRYQDGEEYRPHHDFFYDKVHVQNGGQRVATILLYLTDVEEGGETVFPDSEYKHPEDTLHQWSTCAQAGLAVKPRVGDALLFYSLTPDGGQDKRSLHAGCPVIKGVKWSATKWIRVDKHASA